LLTAATVNASSNDHSAALENLAQCHDIAAASGMRKVLLDVHRARAQILSAQGKQDEAESARAAARDVGAAIAADMATESLRTAFTNEAAKHLS
jgi:DhnA family fructose-bisphosphate aldolase class Ia